MKLLQGWLPRISSPSSVRRFLALATVVSALLWIYASLVPLDYTPLSWEETYRQWQLIPWLDLELFNRADWVANGLVVLPTGILAAAAVGWGRERSWINIAAAPCVTILLVLVVAGIEFVQIWFPTRTKSMNDIAAGYIGAVVAPWLWVVFGSRVRRGVTSFLTLPRFEDRLRWLCAAYFIFVLIFSVMPLDVVLSMREWNARVATGNIRLNPLDIDLLSLQSVKGLVGSAVRMAPIGLLVALSGWRKRGAWLLLLLPVAFEVLQLPLYSKHVTIVEIVGGWFGGAVGYVVGLQFHRLRAVVTRPALWGLAWVLSFGATLTALSFNYDEILYDTTEIARRFREAWQLPLVRYYAGSEYNAATSMLIKIALFGIVGATAFGWQQTSRQRSRKIIFAVTLVSVLIAALFIETVQVFLPPHVADMSDSITYLLGYFVGYQSMKLLWANPQRSSAGDLRCKSQLAAKTS